MLSSGTSLSVIVAVAVAVPMRAPAPLAALSSTVKCSLDSSSVSSVIATVSSCERSAPLAPAANLSVPLPAV